MGCKIISDDRLRKTRIKKLELFSSWQKYLQFLRDQYNRILLRRNRRFCSGGLL